MSELSDYIRCVSGPLEKQLRADIARLHAEKAALEAEVARLLDEHAAATKLIAELDAPAAYARGAAAMRERAAAVCDKAARELRCDPLATVKHYGGFLTAAGDRLANTATDIRALPVEEAP